MKSLRIHHTNTIMRAMCDQSKFNSSSGGRLAPRGFLILLSKDCKLLIVLSLTKVMFRKQVGSQLSPENNWEGHRPHSILHRQRNPTQRYYAHNRAITHRQLQGVAQIAEVTLIDIPVPCLHNTFLSPQSYPALEEKVPSPLRQAELQLCPDTTP